MAVSLQTCPLITEDDIIQARAAVKLHAKDMGFSVLNQTKIVTAASELGRNVIEHGQSGSLRIESVSMGEKIGLRMIFTDKGPGIPNLDLALTDGYTSKKGMGLGLSGSKRLMDEFEVISLTEGGTRVTVTKWK